MKRRQRDIEARRLYIEEMDKEDVDGMYIKDMIREGMTSNESLLWWNASLKTVMALSRVLGCNVEELYEYNMEENKNNR